MKKFTKNRKIIPVSLIIMLLTRFNAINLNAQEISFTFTANHTCEYTALDSVFVENLTQGGDTTLYYPDTVLTLVLTGIDQFLTGSNNFYVSQNYPNPFETKTNIDVFLPECDNITIDVYDLLGRKVANYEGSHESGMQHFTFIGGNSKNYILTVSSKKYLQYIQMIQFGEVSSGVPYLEYNGTTTMNSIKIKQKSLQSLFPYNLGDQLRFTGYDSGDYASIIDTPFGSKDYFFDINHMVPTTPTAGTHIAGEDQIEWHWNTVADADGYKYNTVNDYTSATDNGTSTSYIQAGLDCETNYTLYVWAYNSCGASSFLELNEQTSSISITASASPAAICNGATSVLTASGANTYSWNTGGNTASITVTPSATTTYTVTGTSTAGCTGTATVSVTVNPLPSVSATASPAAICNGATSVLTASGANTYSWNTGDNTASITVTPSSTTTYSVTGTSTANCTNTASVTVTNVFTCGTCTVTYDGVTYNTVAIGNQCWFKENLRTTKYNDGTSIPNVTATSTWTSTTTGAYCCYSNSTSNCSTYGALYNWYAVNTGKLCPSGWHVPSDGEWTTLTNYLSGNSTYWCGGNSSNIAKSLASTTSWSTSTTACAIGKDLSANNSTGFSALPGGDRASSDGSFYTLGIHGYWWSSTENDGSSAWYRCLIYVYADVYRYYFNKSYGFSVRCLRD